MTWLGVMFGGAVCVAVVLWVLDGEEGFVRLIEKAVRFLASIGVTANGLLWTALIAVVAGVVAFLIHIEFWAW